MNVTARISVAAHMVRRTPGYIVPIAFAMLKRWSGKRCDIGRVVQVQELACFEPSTLR
jgi:hypothetical protein